MCACVRGCVCELMRSITLDDVGGAYYSLILEAVMALNKEGTLR